MSDDTQIEEHAISALHALIGTPIATAVAPDPVNQPMIRHSAAAMEDHNPVYTDTGFAAAARFGGFGSESFLPQVGRPQPDVGVRASAQRLAH